MFNRFVGDPSCFLLAARVKYTAQENPSAQSANSLHLILSCNTARGDSIQELAFLDLKYEVENIRPGMEAETLKVLEGVSGQANSGEMLALVRVLEPTTFSVTRPVPARFCRAHVFGYLSSVSICPVSSYFL